MLDIMSHCSIIKHKTTNNLRMDNPILEYSILNVVQENHGNVTQRHISQKLGRSVASVNFALRLLAVKGYIKITGANARNLRYHLTPKGILQKSILAYNFLKLQSTLFEEVRKDLLEKLSTLVKEQVRQVSIYGWTPFTEVAILYLVSEGIKVVSLYTDQVEEDSLFLKIPRRSIERFQTDGEILILMEPLPLRYMEKIANRKLTCFPLP
jgi:DNA-binding Lrp family transcriptional regulator